MDPSRTLLFVGTDVKLKESYALSLAKKLLSDAGKVDAGHHPDLHLFKAEGKIGLHSIASIRKLIDEVYLPPYEAPCKVIIVYDAERMLPASSHALLKTFEEPAPKTTIILLAPSTRELLKTIVSRCQTRYFPGSIVSKNPFTPKIVPLLTEAMSYQELLQQIKALATFVETVDTEDDAEKSLLISKRSTELLSSILSWYRDIQLLKVKGDEKYLHNLEHLSLLRKEAQKNHLTLSKIQKIIQESQTLLQRSLPLTLTLENTLLKIL